MSTIFRTYLPQFFQIQSEVRDFFNNSAMRTAYAYHVREVSYRIFGTNDSLYSQIKQVVGK